MFWKEKKEEDIIAKQRGHENHIKSEKNETNKTRNYKQIAAAVVSILSIAAATAFLFWIDDVSSQAQKETKKEPDEQPQASPEKIEFPEFDEIMEKIEKEREEYYFTPSDPYTNGYMLASGKIPRSSSPPTTGTIFSDRTIKGTAPFTVETEGKRNYYVKLKDHFTNEDVFGVFIRGGETAEIKIPLGTYDLYYATGYKWYGSDILFWTGTQYYKAEETFEFYEDSGYVNGWTVELYLQNNGNMETYPIDPDEF